MFKTESISGKVFLEICWGRLSSGGYKDKALQLTVLCDTYCWSGIV